MKMAKAFARPLAAMGISALALTALSMPKADAATCLLQIKSLGSNMYRVTVGCNDLFVDSFSLWGSDPKWDDDLNFTAQGYTADVPGSVLNEDPWYEEDEVYAQVTAHDIDDNTVTVKSNEVSGNWS